MHAIAINSSEFVRAVKIKPFVLDNNQCTDINSKYKPHSLFVKIKLIHAPLSKYVM